MTDSPALPPQSPVGIEAQASLRSELAGELSAARFELEKHLAELQRAGDSGSILSAVTAQLSDLSALQSTLSGGGHVARADVAASLATARSVAHQASACVEAAHLTNAVHHDMKYQKATAALDNQAAQALAIDRDNNALAHVLADRLGVDLSANDREREALEQERKRAIERGDKMGERTADVLIAGNTLNSLYEVREHVTDPEERRRLDERIREQEKAKKSLEDTHAKQAELDARKEARERGLSPKDTEVFVSQQKASARADLEVRIQSSAGVERNELVRTELVAEIEQAAEGKVKAAAALGSVEAALTPEAKEAAQKAASSLKSGTEAHMDIALDFGVSDEISAPALAAQPSTKSHARG